MLPFEQFINRQSKTWAVLLGQEDERKFTGFLGTEVATTSGTSIDFTGIPSWVTQIEINFDGLSTNGTSNVMLQIGDSGGIETSGYLGSATFLGNAAAIVAANFTTGFGVTGSVVAGSVMHGTFVLTLENVSANTWLCEGGLGYSNGPGSGVGEGSKSLSATLDRVRLTTVGGADTFDAGVLNIRMT